MAMTLNKAVLAWQGQPNHFKGKNVMTEKEIEKALKSTRNLFITGPAGTGKTYLLNKFIEETPNCLTCASTGIAAVNIGGDTAHRIFHIPVPSFEAPSFAKGKKGAITKAQLGVIARADVIIIDEISMLRSEAFKFLIKVLHKAEKEKGKKIRLIVVGDFSQLPPVVKKTELKLFKKFGLDESGFVFTTQEWKSCNFKVVELTEVKRQDNVEFVEILNQIRLGDIYDLGYFDQFVNANPDYENAVCICGTNSEADRINQEYLDSLPGNAIALQSRKEGRCISGCVDDVVVVKEGAKIIFTANDLIHKVYRNGTFGVIEHVYGDDVIVNIDGKSYKIQRRDFPIYTYSVCNGALSKKELGTIHQFPFRIGKAITIHKSQGQTFDKVVISPEIFAPGQLYVALSRVRTPEGLTLLRDILPEHLIIDPTVQQFYDNGYTWEVKKPKRAAAKSKATGSTKKRSTTKKATAKASTKKSPTKSKSTRAKSSAKTVKSGSGTKKTVRKTSTTAKKAPSTKKTVRKSSSTKTTPKKAPMRSKTPRTTSKSKAPATKKKTVAKRTTSRTKTAKSKTSKK